MPDIDVRYSPWANLYLLHPRYSWTLPQALHFFSTPVQIAVIYGSLVRISRDRTTYYIYNHDYQTEITDFLTEREQVLKLTGLDSGLFHIYADEYICILASNFPNLSPVHPYPLQHRVCFQTSTYRIIGSLKKLRKIKGPLVLIDKQKRAMYIQ